MQSPALLELMTEQAARQSKEIVARARQEADAIREAARARSEGHRSDFLRVLESDLTGQARRSRERAEAAAHMVVLTTKDTITDEIMTRARAELQRIQSTPELPGIIDALLEELLRDAPKEGIVVLAHPQQTERVREWLKQHGYDLPVEPLASLKDGVAIQDAEKSYRVTNTLSARLARLESDLRKGVIHDLFEGSEGGKS